MGRLVAGVLAVAWCVQPVGAKDEPFGQETVEILPSKAPQRPGVKTRHHKHSPQRHVDESSHRHAPGAHERRHGMEGHRHEHHGVSTEHLFGFTKGSDIDAVGSRHSIADLSGRFGKQTGSYASASQHFEYGFTPWRDVHVALGGAFAVHRISGVEGLENCQQAGFEGLSFEMRYRLLDRIQAPVGLTIVAEPHWARLDEVDGQRANKFALELTLAVDRELIKDRLYAAFNLIYEPEWVRLKASGEVERESTIGASFAGMTPIMPSVLAGGEIRYLRSYDGAALNGFAGQALFLGPILFANVNDTLALVAAFSVQVAGRAAGGTGRLDLENFERYRAKLKAVIHF